MALYDNYQGILPPVGTLKHDNANDWGGQSFTTTGGYSLERIDIRCAKGTGHDVGVIDVELYDDDGSGHPDVVGGILAFGTILNVNIPEIGSPDWVVCTLDTPYEVAPTTKYCIVVHGDSLSSSKKIYWDYDNVGGMSAYAGGDVEWSTNGGGSWSTTTTFDMLFMCYGSEVVSYVDMAGTGGGVGGGSAALGKTTMANMVATGGGVGGGSAALFISGMPSDGAGMSRTYKRLVIAVNDTIFIEDI